MDEQLIFLSICVIEFCLVNLSLMMSDKKGTAMNNKNQKSVLVTGATGYVAGRLIPLLLSSGYTVRAMGRSIAKMAGRPWGQDPNVELVKGDILDVDSLRKAVNGCGTIYYLVHSMIA